MRECKLVCSDHMTPQSEARPPPCCANGNNKLIILILQTPPKEEDDPPEVVLVQVFPLDNLWDAVVVRSL